MLYNNMRYYFKYLKKRLEYLKIDENIIKAYISEENAKAIILKEMGNVIQNNKPKKKKNVKNKENKTNV